MEPAVVFEEAMAWLKENYDDFGFQLERDVVWTVQTYVAKVIKKRNLPLRVFNDYPMIKGSRRSLSADLVIINETGGVEVAAEFKYEPSHRREDVQPQKLPVVFWGSTPSEAGMGVAHDVQRIRDFVESGRAKIAYAVFIDEGGYFRIREPVPGARWIDWEARTPEGHPVSVLWARWPEGTQAEGR